MSGSTKLTAARLWVITSPTAGRGGVRDAPAGQSYLAHALFALTEVPSPAVARMTVDESWRLYVNHDWLEATEVPEVGRELLHLVWHLLDKHADRARACGVDSRSAPAWRAAADTVIARLAAPHSPASLPARQGRRNTLVETHFDRHVHGSDHVADDDSNALDVCGSGADGVPRHHELRDDSDLPAVTRVESTAIRLRVAEAVEADGRQDPGADSATIRRWASGVVDPKVPWQQVLAGAVRRAATTVAGRGDYTYRRPSRRSVAHVILPSQHRPVPETAVIIDTSGSMDQILLTRAVAELDAILEALQLSATRLTAISVDTTATSSRVRRAADVVLTGGGGTDMSVGLAVTTELRPRPELVVVITDGYTPWPKDPLPDITVIAVIVGHGSSLPPTPDWMARVECVEDS